MPNETESKPKQWTPVDVVRACNGCSLPNAEKLVAKLKNAQSLPALYKAAMEARGTDKFSGAMEKLTAAITEIKEEPKKEPPKAPSEPN